MFGFISFAFKLIFSAIISGAISYIKPKEERNEASAIFASLIGILSTSVISVANQLPDVAVGYGFGLTTLAVLVIVNSLTKDMSFEGRLMYLFASIIGIVVGVGYILHAIALCALIYFVMTNSHELLKHFEPKHENENDKQMEKIIN